MLRYAFSVVALIPLTLALTLFGAVPTDNNNAANTSVDLLSGQGLKDFYLEGQDTSMSKLARDATKSSLTCQTEGSPKQPWGVILVSNISQPVKKGDVIQVAIRARCPNSITGEAFTTFAFEEKAEPNDKSFFVPLSVGNQEQTFHFAFEAARDYQIGEAQVTLFMGYQNQTLEINSLELLDHGKAANISDFPQTKFGYPGMEPDAPWRALAKARIEKIREGAIRIKIVDSKGKNVPAASVRIHLTKHAFAFGTAVNASVLMNDKSANGDHYRQIICDLFNTGVVENDLKWQFWEKDPTLGTAAVNWLHEHGLRVRGHNLVWPSWKWLPEDLSSLQNNPQALKQRIDQHITSILGSLKGKCTEWDVLNEPYSNTDLQRVLGDDEMVSWFRTAREADPEAKLFINDFGILSNNGSDYAHQESYEKTIRFLLDHGAPLDGIGEQSHFGWLLTGPDRILQILGNLGKFRLPIESTEFDIDITDEDLQARYLKDFMTTLFSDPDVEGITLWGFWEQADWKPDAALWRANWEIKPAGQALVNLLKHEWTDETLATDSNGKIATRGFLGHYTIEVTKGAATVKTEADITKTSPPLIIKIPAATN